MYNRDYTAVNNIIIQEYNDRGTREHYYRHLDGEYYADNLELFKLKGNYQIKRFKNRMSSNEIHYAMKHLDYHLKLPFSVGNVLYNYEVPQIEFMIKLLMYYTYTNVHHHFPNNIEYQRIPIENTWHNQSKEIILEYNRQLFTLYGRFIYGFRNRFVSLQNIRTSDKLHLHEVPYGNPDSMGENNFSFTITEKYTNVLNAFGLYR